MFKNGAVDGLGTLVRELGARRALVVTDLGLVASGHVTRAEKALAAAGVAHRRFDSVRENPTTLDVVACLDTLRAGSGADVLVGVGGGSAIDTAKGCALLHAGGGRLEDYRGANTAKGKLLPIVAVPTTAGTGTEVQSFALIEQEDTHQKMACGDPQVAPRIAVLDPSLTATMPPFVAACTGLDALGHAVETAVTSERNAVSRMFSTEAFRLITRWLRHSLQHPEDIEARGQMMLAATWAGVAIEHSMLGAAHSMANPLTALHGIPHGQAVGTMLPHVVQFNATSSAIAAIYADLARSAGLCAPDASDADGLGALVAAIAGLLADLDFPRSLAAHGVTEADLDALAVEAAEQWTAHFNPRPVAIADFRGLFEAALGTGD